MDRFLVHSTDVDSNLDVALNTKITIHPGLNTKNPSGSCTKLEWHLMHLFHQGKKNPWTSNLK